MQILHINPHIDIETFSSEPLNKCGIRRYVESPDFEIQLVSFQIHGFEQMYTYDLAGGERLPDYFIKMLTDERVIKIAYNAAFERLCFSAYLGVYLHPRSWFCTMAQAAYFGLPLSLDKATEVLGTSDRKMKEGKDLVRFFGVPCKPSKANNWSTRNYPFEHPEKYAQYKIYNPMDVKAEASIYTTLRAYDFPNMEWQTYILDQVINDRGIKIDREFAQRAYDIDQQYKAEVFALLQDKTGLNNPNSRDQVLRWLQENASDVETDDLKKDTVTRLLNETSDTLTENVLSAWQNLAKKSTSKYDAMLKVINKDGRARGLFQYYGANRTGRFAGRLIQLQNLTQPTIGKKIKTDAERVQMYKQAKHDVMAYDLPILKLMYSDIAGLLSSLVRPTFIPEDGKLFYIVDYSAIEARVLAWLAGEQWRLDVFAGDGKIYEASASRLFKVPVELVTKDSDYRKKGKVAELAFGYQGSVNAFNNMAGKEASNYRDSEKKEMVRLWRNENPAIVQFWTDVDNCALMAVYNRNQLIDGPHGIRFLADNNYLMIRLLNGRVLHYYKPQIGTGKFGNPCVEYWGTDSTKNFKIQQTYGGKLTENIVQATARDILVDAMKRVEAEGYGIVMHVHDEITVEHTQHNAQWHLDKITEIMTLVPTWATGLPLAAEGFISEFYRK